MKKITETLIDFICDLDYSKLPSEVIEKTKLFISDFYAAALAGYNSNKEFNNSNFEYYTEMGGVEEASVLFSDVKLPACNAAYLNAMYAHGADMDDGNKLSAGHIGTHVIPAVLALAEKYHSNWKDIIVAINVGYELFNRVAGAAQPSLYNKGFHSTGIAGGLACAGACAKLLGLDYSQTYNAISIAIVQSSGLIIIDETGQSCKPINPANAAKTGLISAELAKRGIDAPKHPLESRKGWFNAFSDEYNENVLFKDLGCRFTICDSYLKQYPTCRHTHSCIDAALDLRGKIREIEEIDDIEIYIYPSAIKSAGTIDFPSNSGEAKFSIKYAVAIALLNGCFTLDDLTSISCDDKIVKLIKKIDLIIDNEMENREKGIRGCRMKIATSFDDHETIILSPKGEGRNSLTWEDMASKLTNSQFKSVFTFDVEKFVANIKAIEPNIDFQTVNCLFE